MKKLLMFAVVFLFGCATAQIATGPVVDTFVVDRPFAETWAASVAVFAERSLQIKAIEKDSGLITTEHRVYATGYGADKKIKAMSVRPSRLLAMWDAGRYSVTLYASPESATSTKIKITAHMEAFDSNDTRAWHPCKSRGIIEGEIYAAITEKLK